MALKLDSLVVLLDGKLVPASEARVSIFDHGFLFGDSVYEVVRTVMPRGTRTRCLFGFDPHMDRLEGSARGLSLTIPWSRDEIRSQVEKAIERVPGGDVYVRIIITRGVGELDINPETCERPGSVIIAKPLPSYPRSWYDDGIAVQLVGTMRNPTRSVSPSIKSGNYLNSVLALMEAKRAGALEAVMLNENGHLTECTTSNIFFVKDGVLHTPSLDCGILSGITRSTLLEAARKAGVDCREGRYPAQDLRSADEAFITSTTKDLVPVKTVNGVPVSSSPGPLTKKLTTIFLERQQELVSCPAPAR